MKTEFTSSYATLLHNKKIHNFIKKSNTIINSKKSSTKNIRSNLISLDEVLLKMKKLYDYKNKSQHLYEDIKALKLMLRKYSNPSAILNLKLIKNHKGLRRNNFFTKSRNDINFISNIIDFTQSLTTKNNSIINIKNKRPPSFNNSLIKGKVEDKNMINFINNKENHNINKDHSLIVNGDNNHINNHKLLSPYSFKKIQIKLRKYFSFNKNKQAINNKFNNDENYINKKIQIFHSEDSLRIVNTKLLNYSVKTIRTGVKNNNKEINKSQSKKIFLLKSLSLMTNIKNSNKNNNENFNKEYKINEIESENMEMDISPVNKLCNNKDYLPKSKRYK